MTRRGGYVPSVNPHSKDQLIIEKLFRSESSELFKTDAMAAFFVGLRWQASSSKLGSRCKSGWAQIGIEALLIVGKYGLLPENAALIAPVPVFVSSMIHNVCREGRATKQSCRSCVEPFGSCVINVLRGVTNIINSLSHYQKRTGFGGLSGGETYSIERTLTWTPTSLKSVAIAGNAFDVMILVIQDRL